jgi:hypothetical protein
VATIKAVNAIAEETAIGTILDRGVVMMDRTRVADLISLEALAMVREISGGSNIAVGLMSHAAALMAMQGRGTISVALIAILVTMGIAEYILVVTATIAMQTHAHVLEGLKSHRHSAQTTMLKCAPAATAAVTNLVIRATLSSVAVPAVGLELREMIVRETIRNTAPRAGQTDFASVVFALPARLAGQVGA